MGVTIADTRATAYSPFDFAQRMVGEVRELPGEQHAPFIQWCFECCNYGPDTPDEVPWCSAFANRMAWWARAPRSKSAAARSWLTVGKAIAVREATPGWDIVVLKRGNGAQPGPEVIKAPGHVGFFAGYDVQERIVYVLGGNQNDGVTVQGFAETRILGVRRLI